MERHSKKSMRTLYKILAEGFPFNVKKRAMKFNRGSDITEDNRRSSRPKPSTNDE